MVWKDRGAGAEPARCGPIFLILNDMPKFRSGKSASFLLNVTIIFFRKSSISALVFLKPFSASLSPFPASGQLFANL